MPGVNPNIDAARTARATNSTQRLTLEGNLQRAEILKGVRHLTVTTFLCLVVLCFIAGLLASCTTPTLPTGWCEIAHPTDDVYTVWTVDETGRVRSGPADTSPIAAQLAEWRAARGGE